MGTPPTPQGILQKKPFFFFLYALEKQQKHVAKFAPSLDPSLTPSLDLLLFGTANQAPTLWNCHRPYGPPNPLLQPRPLVYPPVHQASSGGYPPPPHRASFKLPSPLRPPQPSPAASLSPPSQPFPDPFPWNQGPWSTPPSTRPAPVGHPLKKNIFLLFVRVRNNKNTTCCEICSVPGARVSTTYPPGTEALLPDPFPGLAPLWNSQPSPPSSLELPSPLRPLSCNQGPWSTPPFYQASSSGYPPPTPQRITLRNLLRPWGPSTTYPPGTEALAPLPEPLPRDPPSTSLTPFPRIKALGLPPRPPGQLRWVPPSPHRASFKKNHFSSLCTR